MRKRRPAWLGLGGTLLLLAGVACGGALAPTSAPIEVPLSAPTGTATSTPVLLPIVVAGAPEPNCAAPGAAPASAAVYLRVNQLGFLPAEPKMGLAMTGAALAGSSFSVVADGAPGGPAILSAPVGADRGGWGDFAHVYELDFSGLSQPGAYRLALGGDVSPCFVVGPRAYASLIPASLQFFQVQRCGATSPLMHGVCHLEDAIAQGGPQDGLHIDTTGGWHDAGDYIKFLTTSAYAVDLLLSAYQRHPAAFADGDHNGTPDALDEARVGLSWMLKLWDPAHNVLYYQVGDESDHSGWRLPEGDDANRPPRTLWPCAPGHGANVAGKAAAALALAAALWGNPSASFHDAGLAASYLAAARQIYAYGQARPAAQAGAPQADGPFYAEQTWQDDLSLAAAELYRATGEPAFLQQARGYAADALGQARIFDWSELSALAAYEIARLDPTYVPTATALLATDLAGYQARAGGEPFRFAADYVWGSAENSAGAGLTAEWYADLSGSSLNQRLALAQRDYLLGGNPWGVSFVNSIGSDWPHHPHHQVADYNNQELVGFWDEGPVAPSIYEAQTITLLHPDRLAAFQSPLALFHDDVADYTTNEPTISMNAAGIALAAWYAPAGP